MYVKMLVWKVAFDVYLVKKIMVYLLQIFILHEKKREIDV